MMRPDYLPPKKRKRKPRKATHRQIDAEYLEGRLEGLEKAGWGKPKWIFFCEVLLRRGFDLSLYEARQTVSKYIDVTRPGSDKTYKVRFSNHAPNNLREKRGDCDFFVGRNNNSITTTEQAIAATMEHFEEELKG